MRHRKSRKYIMFLVIIANITAMVSQNLLAAGDPVPEASAESQVEIRFTEGDAVVEPLDPDAPVYPEEGGTGGGASLALNFVSPFYFNEQGISPGVEEYPTTTEKPYIQVTDVRGTGGGWEIYAKASGFTDSEGAPSLKGSSIAFEDTSLATTTSNVDAPTIKSTFSLPSNGSFTRVVEATPLTGMGTWLTRWYTTSVGGLNNSVRLIVPGGTATLGRHTAKITWYLTLGSVS